jgi:hypothetical protein
MTVVLEDAQEAANVLTGTVYNGREVPSSTQPCTLSAMSLRNISFLELEPIRKRLGNHAPRPLWLKLISIWTSIYMKILGQLGGLERG